VGLREILDIKHGGIEKYGFHCHYLGTSVPLERVLEIAQQANAPAVLISTIVTHADIHKYHMKRLHELAQARGLRQRLVLVAGGMQVTHELAQQCGLDTGFGRGTTGREVASFLVRKLRTMETA
jgi:D-ornithine 4,5-aminomutase subunit beta